MRAFCYSLLALLLTPALATAQTPNAVFEVSGVQYPVLATLSFGAQLENGINIGPEGMAFMFDEEGDGTVFDGCDSVTNGDEVKGTIALVSRGTCPYVMKAANAAAVGAIAVVIYQDERNGQEDDTLVHMEGDCDPSVCSVPAIFISRVTYKSFLPEMPFPFEATIIPNLSDLPTVGEVSTGLVNLPIYDQGFFGTTPESGYAPVADETPFTYNGFEPLCVGTVLVGVDGTVAGSPYRGTSEYIRNSTVITGTVGENRPAAQADFQSEELGVRVVNLAFGEIGDPYVFIQLFVSSTTGADMADAYLGVFADWDVVDDGDDTSTDDLGGYNNDLNLAYVFDADMGQYYGVMPFVGEEYPGSGISGYGVDVTAANDAQLFANLTSANPAAAEAAERAVVVGQGPYTIPADEANPLLQAFVLVAGASEAELFDNAASVYFYCTTQEGCGVVPDASMFAAAPVTPTASTSSRTTACKRPVTAEESIRPAALQLATAYPNPVTTTARIGFTLPTAEEVRVEVYDLLGRRVATLTDGLRAAGEHTVTLDAAGLPSGVYVVRLATPSATLTERVTVVR